MSPVVIDFTQSIFQEDNIFRRSFCGSEFFTAPEVYEQEVQSYAIDIWSLGVILYYMLHGKYPYKGESTILTYSQILKTTPVFDAKYSEGLRDFVMSIMNKKIE